MKTKIILVLTLTLFACLLLQSCTAGPLEGDWFPCKDEACTRLDDDGIRFTAGNRWALLEAPGSTYDAGESYEMDGPRGDYTFDGTDLTIFLDGEPEQQTIRVEFDNGDLLLHVKTSTDVACAQPEGGPVHCDPPPPQEELKVLRFKRAGDAQPVPLVPPDQIKKGDPPNTTTPAPPPADGDAK